MVREKDWTYRIPRHAAAERIILNVCGETDIDDRDFAALGNEGWEALEAIAVRTRTANLLHRFLRGSTTTTPVAISARLADLYRRQSIYALEQKTVLGRVANLLEAKGIGHVALKGSALAYSIYPQPAMRPLRDIDVLVPAHRAEEARDWLLRNRFAPAPWAKTYGIEFNHQLPELVCEDHEVTVEIHHRVFSRAWGGDAALSSLLLDTAQSPDASAALRVAAPLANLLHLTVHATLHNCFENGPLTIADVHRLWRHGNLDPMTAVRAADQMHLGRSLDLLLALAQDAGPIEIPRALWPRVESARPFIADAQEAMFQVPAEAGKRALMRRLETGEEGSGPLSALRKAVRPTPQKLAELVSTHADDRMRWTAYPLWAWQRGREYLQSMANPALRDAAKRDARMLNWLRGGHGGWRD